MYLFAVRAGEQHWTVCEVMLLHFRIKIISLFTTKYTRPAKHNYINTLPETARGYCTHSLIPRPYSQVFKGR